MEHDRSDLEGSIFLVEKLVFETNPCDSRVVNKMVYGKQCKILWHVDDLKLSDASFAFHMDHLDIEHIQDRMQW